MFLHVGMLDKCRATASESICEFDDRYEEPPMSDQSRPAAVGKTRFPSALDQMTPHLASSSRPAHDAKSHAKQIGNAFEMSRQGRFECRIIRHSGSVEPRLCKREQQPESIPVGCDRESPRLMLKREENVYYGIGWLRICAIPNPRIAATMTDTVTVNRPESWNDSSVIVTRQPAPAAE
jgi:hypothetical protein